LRLPELLAAEHVGGRVAKRIVDERTDSGMEINDYQGTLTPALSQRERE
jgi:hypothetical protein